MCIHCIDNRFKTSKVWTCTLCGDVLKKNNWDDHTIEEQRFRNEVINRQETNRVFTLEERDFPSKRAYDDYLEQSADIVFQLTYGSKMEQSAARTKLADFAKQYRTMIDKSKSRRFQEERDAERRERMAVGEEAEDTGGQQHPSTMGMGGLSFILPTPDDSVQSAHKTEEDILAKLPESQRLAARYKMEELRKMAGGFSREMDVQRSKMEVDEAIWFNIL